MQDSPVGVRDSQSKSTSSLKRACTDAYVQPTSIPCSPAVSLLEPPGIGISSTNVDMTWAQSTDKREVMSNWALLLAQSVEHQREAEIGKVSFRSLTQEWLRAKYLYRLQS